MGPFLVIAAIVGLTVGGLVLAVRGSVLERPALSWAGVAVIALGGLLAFAIGLVVMAIQD